MILTRVRLEPFGRFAGEEVGFDAGLTVVLGPNEAGKSTLLAAIRSALLLSTRLRKTDFDQHVRRYLPVGGGDTARVELGFRAGGRDYRLARRWGAGAGSELQAPDGAAVRDEETIKVRVASLLPAAPRTVAAVLFLLQAELSSTVEALADVEAVAVDLGTVLRRAVAETGGVSVERFKSTLEEELARQLRHWDEARCRPEENRGGRWKKEVGATLRAYYELEDARAELEKARSHESALDELNRSIEAAAVPLGRSTGFVREHEQAWRDARERGRLEAELRAARGELERLAKDNADWPVAESRLAALAEEIGRAEAKAGPLARERAQSEAAEKARALREQAARVERRRSEASGARAALDALPPMEPATLAAMQRAAREADRLAACVEESATVTVEARRRVALRISAAGAAPAAVELGGGESRSMAASAPVVIEHPDFVVTVAPKGNAAEQAARAARAAAERDSLLARASCASVAEAEERLRTRGLAAAALQRSEQELAAELAGEPPERFDARVAALGPVAEARPSAVVAAEIAKLEASIEALAKERSERQERLAELRSRYQSADRLMRAAAMAVHREEETLAALARSVPLPAGFADAAAFLQRYEAERAEAERLRGEQIRLLALREEREQHAPDQSADEAADLVADAERRFEAAVARGKALRRVQETAARALGPGEDEVFAGIGTEVRRLFSAMTLGRYGSVTMDQALPTGVAGTGAPELPRELLSVGTQDLLGLAVRMAMASTLIGDSGGFLVMDDPLVDLDPGRQAAAAAAIRAFAERRQVVLFTCHPSHAELLGGTLVRLR